MTWPAPWQRCPLPDPYTLDELRTVEVGTWSACPPPWKGVSVHVDTSHMDLPQIQGWGYALRDLGDEHNPLYYAPANSPLVFCTHASNPVLSLTGRYRDCVSASPSAGASPMNRLVLIPNTERRCWRGQTLLVTETRKPDNTVELRVTLDLVVAKGEHLPLGAYHNRFGEGYALCATVEAVSCAEGSEAVFTPGELKPLELPPELRPELETKMKRVRLWYETEKLRKKMSLPVLTMRDR